MVHRRRADSSCYAAVHLAAEIIQRYVDDTGIIDSELMYKIRDFESFEKTLP